MNVKIKAERVRILNGDGSFRRNGTDYTANVNGVAFQNGNLSTIKSVIRGKLYRNGYRGKVAFIVE